MTLQGAAVTHSPTGDPAGSPAIEVAGLVKVYKKTRAVDGISFEIARGSITDCSAAMVPAKPRPLP